MIVRLHRQARTTPAIRAEIQAAPASVSNPELAARYGVTLPTIHKWRNRQTVDDGSHTAHAYPLVALCRVLAVSASDGLVHAGDHWLVNGQQDDT